MIWSRQPEVAIPKRVTWNWSSPHLLHVTAVGASRKFNSVVHAHSVKTGVVLFSVLKVQASRADLWLFGSTNHSSSWTLLGSLQFSVEFNWIDFKFKTVWKHSDTLLRRWASLCNSTGCPIQPASCSAVRLFGHPLEMPQASTEGTNKHLDWVSLGILSKWWDNNLSNSVTNPNLLLLGTN